MPSMSYRLLGCSRPDVALSSQLGCASKMPADQIPLPTATSFELPPVQLDSEAILSLENFSMLTLSPGCVNPLRTSLEFSEEESFSDESTYTQRTSFPDCTALFHENYHNAKRPSSIEKPSAILPQDPQDLNCLTSAPTRDSVKDQPNPSNQPFAFLSEPYKKHASRPTSRNIVKEKRSQILQRPVKPTSKTDSFHSDHSFSSDDRAAKPKPSDNRSGANHLDVVASSSVPGTGSYSPECQSHTMSSVFEDDSDDDDVPYLKKVFPAWITNNKKPKTTSTSTPKLVKQKSRLFKAHRSSLSTSS